MLFENSNSVCKKAICSYFLQGNCSIPRNKVEQNLMTYRYMYVYKREFEGLDHFKINISSEFLTTGETHIHIPFDRICDRQDFTSLSYDSLKRKRFFFGWPLARRQLKVYRISLCSINVSQTIHWLLVCPPFSSLAILPFSLQIPTLSLSFFFSYSSIPE